MKVTTKTKLALWFAGALALILGAFSAGVYLAVERALMESVDERLRTRIESVERDFWLDERGRAHLSGQRSEEEQASPLTEVVRLRDGAVVYRSDDHEDTDTLDRTGAVRRNILDWKSPRSVFLASGHEVRLMAVRTSARGDVYEVWMAESLDPVHAEQRELAGVLAVLFPLAVGAAIVGGRWLAGRAIRPIEDSLAAMRRFTADASHELRTPLAAIRTEFEVTLRRDRAPEEYRTSIRTALEEVVSLSELAGKLLDLSRADAGGLPLERNEVAVDALARGVCEGWASHAAEKGIDLGCTPDGPALVRGDARRLRELLENLVHNAIKFTEASGRVTVRVRPEPRAIVVEVEDTGCGIGAEHLPHVFERFYRADASRTGDGAGLGLAIAKAVAEAHGGSIAVASEPRKGSIFSVRLPRA